MKFKIGSKPKDQKSILIDFFSRSDNNVSFIFDKLNILEKNYDATGLEFQLKALAVAVNGDLQLSKQEFIDGKRFFATHYADIAGSNSFYTDLETTWSDFKTASLNGVATPSMLALRFIHRYNPDPASQRWYLTVEKLTMTPPADMSATPKVYALTSRNEFFDILPDGSVKNNNGATGLTDDGSGVKYDQHYFNSILNDGNPLSPADHIRSVIYSWEEIQQLYCDNTVDNLGVSRGLPNLYKICFGGLSKDYTGDTSGASRVSWPHSITLYMKHNGVQLVMNDSTVIATSFNGYGADYDTLCPPGGNKYKWPESLNFQSPC